MVITRFGVRVWDLTGRKEVGAHKGQHGCSVKATEGEGGEVIGREGKERTRCSTCWSTNRWTSGPFCIMLLVICRPESSCMTLMHTHCASAASVGCLTYHCTQPGVCPQLRTYPLCLLLVWTAALPKIPL